MFILEIAGEGIIFIEVDKVSLPWKRHLDPAHGREEAFRGQSADRKVDVITCIWKPLPPAVEHIGS